MHAQAATSITSRDFRAIRLVFFLEALALGAWLPRIPDMKDALSLSDGVLGLCLVGMPAGTLLGFTFAARVARRLGLRRACMAGGTAFAVSFMLPGFSPNATALFLALFVTGLAVAQIEVAMNAKAGQMEMLSRRRIMSRCHGFWSIGSVAGALIGGGFAKAGFSMAEQFLIVGPLAAAAAWAAGAALPVGPPGVARPVRERVFALPPAALVLLCLMPVGTMALEGAMMDWAAVFVRDVLLEGPIAAATVYAVFSSFMAVTRLAGDALADRFGPVRVVLVSSLAAAGGILLFATSGGLAVAMLGAALCGFGVATVYPMAVSTASAAPGRSPEQNVAAVSFIAFSAFLVGPPLIGGIADLFSLRWALGGLCLLALVSASLSSHVGPRPDRENSE